MVEAVLPLLLGVLPVQQEALEDLVEVAELVGRSPFWCVQVRLVAVKLDYELPLAPLKTAVGYFEESSAT